MPESLLDQIRAIPGSEGFWKVSTESTFIKMGLEMRAKGIADDRIVSMLADLYNAVAHEHGE